MYKQTKLPLTGLPGFNNYYQAGGNITPIYKYGGYLGGKPHANYHKHANQRLHGERLLQQRQKDNSKMIIDRPFG